MSPPSRMNRGSSTQRDVRVSVELGASGRPLRKGESVHHKNGIHDDNRSENLELWVRAQRPGKRVRDLVKWAVEFVAMYETEVKELPE